MTDQASVPLYWTQNGYGLKPPPVLVEDRTHAQNLEALKKHFSQTIPVYGPHVCLASHLDVYFADVYYQFPDGRQLG